jgi:hypothetical protein
MSAGVKAIAKLSGLPLLPIRSNQLTGLLSVMVLLAIAPHQSNPLFFILLHATTTLTRSIL